MTTYRIVYTPEAEAQLAELYRYLAGAASPETAARYTGAVAGYCESLRTFPHRGSMRDDIRPGLRVTSYRKRVAIAFEVNADQVRIIGIFYGGLDYEVVLQEENDAAE